MSHDLQQLAPRTLDATSLRALCPVLAGSLPRGATWGAGWRRGEEDHWPALVEDHRQARSGDLFVAIRGQRFDGHSQLESLRAQGVFSVGEAGSPADLQVEDTRTWLALAAEALEGHPARTLKLIGITGTNGKTTTTWLLHRLLLSRDAHCGHCGTLGSWIGPSAELNPGLTTPGASQLSRLGARIREAGGRHLVMEVSSHAIDQQRIAGLSFHGAIFLNLSPEHLDYHLEMEDYFRCKADFMARKETAWRLVFTDDPWGRRLAAELGSGCITAGVSPDADWRLVKRRVDGSAQILELITPGGSRERYRIPLPGAHNAQNALAALVAMRLQGLQAEELAGLCAGLSSAPGRLELHEKHGHARVIIDYAHTPDGYEKCYAALAELKPRRIFTVFGCGGDRDRSKRPRMAAIAESHSHRLLITTDNPRSEDPLQIATDMRAGLSHPETSQWIPDRAEAIRAALTMAEPEDLVLLLGKGHERYQLIGSGKLHFDEREVLADVWNA
ncbi:MAG: UDP-N-acetylmuramoyl-L-alanyl-D-glutamate--2,6-diaminopimelate ligase [Candidatus Delongbacteria bacterium]|nr:UDP-N-acetylmuramoyl-L-alanyl-D-glutamate--2,6-diaminopimelate ligase [Candidatus Delongbacteria bacterium]